MAHNDFVLGGSGSGAWTGTPVVHAMMEKFDQRQFEAINGDLGGTWAPSSIITIGGSGIALAGTNHQVTGTLTVNSGATLQLASGSLVNSPGASLTGTYTFGQNAGPGTNATVTVNTGSSLVLHSSVSVDNSTWSMVGTIVNMTNGGEFNINGTVGGAQINATSCAVGFTNSTITYTNTLIKGGRADYQDIAANPTWDANRTFTVSDGRIIDATAITAPHTWILSTTGALKGDRITFVNRGNTNIVTLHVGAATYSVYVNAGNSYEVEFVFSGTAWVQIGAAGG